MKNTAILLCEDKAPDEILSLAPLVLNRSVGVAHEPNRSKNNKYHSSFSSHYLEKLKTIKELTLCHKLK